MTLTIIYEDNDIIVIEKPAGIAVQTSRLGQMDLENMVKNYLSKNAKSSGVSITKAPYLAVVHRLDQPVSGIIVFAKTQKAAANLSKQLQSNAHKEYIAYVFTQDTNGPTNNQKLEDYLIKDSKSNKALAVSKETTGAKRAVLNYEIISQNENLFVLRILLETGRFHQIRAQLSNAGMPIINDVKYDGISLNDLPEHLISSELTTLLCQRGAIALSACRLSIKHPSSGKTMEFTTQAKP